MTKLIGEISLQAQQLMTALQKARVGETISYDTLSKAIEADVRQFRGQLQTARRRLLRDENIVFGCVRTVGLKRLDDLEIVNEGESGLVKVRRKARRSAEVLTKAHPDRLTVEDRSRLNAVLSLHGAITLFAKKRSITKIQRLVANANTGALPVGRVVEQFK